MPLYSGLSGSPAFSLNAGDGVISEVILFKLLAREAKLRETLLKVGG
jgi:hypothetical protein